MLVQNIAMSLADKLVCFVRSAGVSTCFGFLKVFLVSGLLGHWLCTQQVSVYGTRGLMILGEFPLNDPPNLNNEKTSVV